MSKLSDFPIPQWSDLEHYVFLQVTVEVNHWFGGAVHLRKYMKDFDPIVEIVAVNDDTCRIHWPTSSPRVTDHYLQDAMNFCEYVHSTIMNDKCVNAGVVLPISPQTYENYTNLFHHPTLYNRQYRKANHFDVYVIFPVTQQQQQQNE